MTRPLVLGLTGSVGMGKSSVARMFEALGVPVFDADAVVHRLQGPGGGLVASIERAFPGVAGPDGVDRKRLGAAVFGDPAALARLEGQVALGALASRFPDIELETSEPTYRDHFVLRGLRELQLSIPT